MTWPLERKVDPRTAAVIVVDVQNDYCHPDGIRGKVRSVEHCVAMAPTLVRLIDEARVRARLHVADRAHAHVRHWPARSRRGARSSR